MICPSQSPPRLSEVTHSLSWGALERVPCCTPAPYTVDLSFHLCKMGNYGDDGRRQTPSLALLEVVSSGLGSPLSGLQGEAKDQAFSLTLLILASAGT